MTPVNYEIKIHIYMKFIQSCLAGCHGEDDKNRQLKGQGIILYYY